MCGDVNAGTPISVVPPPARTGKLPETLRHKKTVERIQHMLEDRQAVRN
jgi:hypothetical protein